MGIITNIFKFITDPKNTRMILLGIIVIFALLFLQQCNKNEAIKGELEAQKIESLRVQNNFEASQDTIKQYITKDSIIRGEKLVYKLKAEELEGEYSELLGNYELEKNKKVRVIANTGLELKESIDSIPYIVFVSDSSIMAQFKDSTNFGQNNYRILSGDVNITYEIDSIGDSLIVNNTKISADLVQGISLNTFLIEDKETGKVKIVVDTKYPGITFTEIEGAYIMDDPVSKKVTRKFRKNNSIGVGVGYGVLIDVRNGNLSTGPYLGVQYNWTPKWLQW